MKHLFIFAAAATLACGCAQINEAEPAIAGEPQPIGFEAPVLGTATRGDKVATDTYPAGWNFTVWAQWDETEFTAWTNPSYMDNVECAPDFTDEDDTIPSTWRPEKGDGGKTYHWPKKGVLSFLAASPSNWVIEGAANAAASTRNVWAKPTVETDGEATIYKGFTSQVVTLEQSGNQEDLMYSNLAKNKKAAQMTWPKEWPTQDGSNPTNPTASTYNGVQIWFNHALANIKFAAYKSGDDMEAVEVVIKSVVLGGMKNKGKFEEHADDPSKKPMWTTEGDAIDYDNVIADANGYEVDAIYDASANPDPTDLTTEGAKDLMVMPQVITDDMTITVVYTIKTATGTPIEQTAEIKLSELTFSDAAAGDTPAFDVNKQYTFTIIFGLEKIYFSPEVNDWEDVETSYETPAS